MKPLDEIVLPSKLGHVDQQQIRVNFHDCHEIKSPLNRWKYAFELRTMMIESSLPSSSFPPPLSDYHRSTFVYPSLPLIFHPSSHSKKHSRILIRLLIREISLITPPLPSEKTNETRHKRCGLPCDKSLSL